MFKYTLIVFSWVYSFFANSQTYENGTNLFDNSIVHRIDVTFTQSNFWDSLNYYYNDALTNGGDVQYMQTVVSIDGNEFDSVGFKQKGFYSNWGASMTSQKLPFKINLAKYVDGQKYDGLKKINLSNGFEDPSMLRDALAYKFMRDAGIPSPRTAYAKVYLNGTYWGLYILVEELDKNFLQNWYANKDGNLYKCINNTSLSWQGTDVVNYTDEFDLQTNKTTNDWSQFTRFVDIINNSGTHFIDSLPMVLDVQNYLNVLAADVIMFNWDSYYDHGRNFFLYDDPDEN
ncbi:MAG: CotH kinase family protein, partial [Fluviicola sp.]